MALHLEHLLVPVDFGESSDGALGMAVELAERFHAQLTLVHVYEIPSYFYDGMAYATADLLTPIEEAARAYLDKTLRAVRERIPQADALLQRGAPAAELLTVIERVHPDLVIMGTHGRTGVRRALLGSVAERVVRLSAAPVLTVRGATGQRGPSAGPQEVRS